MKPRNLNTALKNNIDERDRIHDQESQYFKVTGEIECDGPGEGVTNIVFPIYFTEKPRFSFGLELIPGQPIAAGRFPRCSATVIQWGQRAREDGTIVYSGAALSISIQGPTGQVLIVQWHMEGTGLRGPVPTT